MKLKEQLMTLHVIYLDNSQDTYNTEGISFTDNLITVDEGKGIVTRIPYTSLKKFIISE